jgi:hypothetical protein
VLRVDIVVMSSGSVHGTAKSHSTNGLRDLENDWLCVGGIHDVQSALTARQQDEYTAATDSLSGRTIDDTQEQLNRRIEHEEFRWGTRPVPRLA